MKLLDEGDAVRSPRLPARELGLSSSFKPVSEATRASGETTPTRALLGTASDIITSSLLEPEEKAYCVPADDDSTAVCNSTGSKLRSCLSSGRHSDNAIPPTSAARAALHSTEQRGLHWKPDLLVVSAAGTGSDVRELQARYLKLEADLHDSEAAKALLQKQLHRVQEAMKQNRDDLENAQRSALAAAEKATAAEAKTASLVAEVCFEYHKLGAVSIRLACAWHTLCNLTGTGCTSADRTGKS